MLKDIEIAARRRYVGSGLDCGELGEPGDACSCSTGKEVLQAGGRARTMKIKLTLEHGDTEYGVGVTVDAALFRDFDQMSYSTQRLWVKALGIFQTAAWIRKDTAAHAAEQILKAGAERGARLALGRLQGVGRIGKALEDFAKQAGDAGHPALAFTMVCFSSALEEISQGVDVNLDSLRAKINAGIAEPRRRHEVNQRYAAQAKEHMEGEEKPV